MPDATTAQCADARSAAEVIEARFRKALDHIYDVDAMLGAIVAGLESEERLEDCRLIRLAMAAMKSIDAASTEIDEQQLHVRQEVSHG